MLHMLSQLATTLQGSGSDPQPDLLLRVYKLVTTNMFNNHDTVAIVPLNIKSSPPKFWPLVDSM